MKWIVLVLMAATMLSTSVAAPSARVDTQVSKYSLVMEAARAARADRSSGSTTAAHGQCCKICTVGKACGDTCISRDKICHVGQGCACDG
jgi:hypothetical protein